MRRKQEDEFAYEHESTKRGRVDQNHLHQGVGILRSRFFRFPPFFFIFNLFITTVFFQEEKVDKKQVEKEQVDKQQVEEILAEKRKELQDASADKDGKDKAPAIQHITMKFPSYLFERRVLPPECLEVEHKVHANYCPKNRRWYAHARNSFYKRRLLECLYAEGEQVLNMTLETLRRTKDMPCIAWSMKDPTKDCFVFQGLKMSKEQEQEFCRTFSYSE